MGCFQTGHSLLGGESWSHVSLRKFSQFKGCYPRLWLKPSNNSWMVCMCSYEIALVCIFQKPHSSNFIERALFLKHNRSPEAARGECGNAQHPLSPGLSLLIFLTHGRKTAVHIQASLQTESGKEIKRCQPTREKQNLSPKSPANFC